MRHTSLPSERPQRFIRLLPLTPPASPQTPQSTAFISHLTNSNPCGNIHTKVPLTVSPFRPPFLPQSDVYPKVQYCLPSLPTTHYPLVLTSPVFSSACRLLLSLASLFRTRPLCFQQLAASFPKNRGVGVGMAAEVWQNSSPVKPWQAAEVRTSSR